MLAEDTLNVLNGCSSGNNDLILIRGSCRIVWSTLVMSPELVMPVSLSRFTDIAMSGTNGIKGDSGTTMQKR